MYMCDATYHINTIQLWGFSVRISQKVTRATYFIYQQYKSNRYIIYNNMNGGGLKTHRTLRSKSKHNKQIDNTECFTILSVKDFIFGVQYASMYDV